MNHKVISQSFSSTLYMIASKSWEADLNKMLQVFSDSTFIRNHLGQSDF